MNQFRTQEQPPILPQRDLRVDRFRIGIPLLAVATVFLTTLVVQTVLNEVLLAVAPTLVKAGWYTWFISMAPMYVIAMPLSLLLYRMVPAEAPQKGRMSIPAFLGLLAICFVLSYAGSLIGNMVNHLIGVISGHTPENELANTAAQAPLWSTLLFVGILAPIMEELFYRKLVLDRLTRYGDLPAILISGVAFGLIHGNFSQFFYAAGIGMLFGYVYLKTGKIRYTVFLHLAFNLIGGVYAAEMLRRMERMQAAPPEQNAVVTVLQNWNAIPMAAAYFLFMGAVLVGAPIAIAKMAKKVRLTKAQNPLSAKQWASVLLINPCVWFFAMVVFVLFALAIMA